MNEALIYSNKLGYFENIHRSYDKSLDKYVVGISSGGIYLTEEDEVITTVLGSCIAVCVRDLMTGITGMNHFLIAGNKNDINNASGHSLFQYGLYSMDYMLNKMIHLGCSKDTMEIKIFGGGAIISSVGDVGKSNVRFVKNYINLKGYRLAGEDVGGNHPRKINYFSGSGKVMVKRMRSLHKQVIANREKRL